MNSLTARAALVAALTSIGIQLAPEQVEALAPTTGPARAIEDCGAVCDGVTEDTAALNTCLRERLHVELPPRRTCAVRPTHTSGYLAVHLPAGGTLSGSGPSSVLRVLPTMVGTQVRTARGVGSIGAVSGVTVRDLAIRNEAPRLSNEQGHAVYFYGGATNVRVHDVTVLQAPGDGVYLGQDVAFASVRDVVAYDVARNAVTVEGNSALPREGIRISGVTRGYTEASDPTQRGGRLVDVEVSGAGLSGLVVSGNTGSGGIELGNVDRAAVVGNVADRIHMVTARRTVLVGNTLWTDKAPAPLMSQRGASWLAASNWLGRSTAGSAVVVEDSERFPGVAPADISLHGLRIDGGTLDIRPKNARVSDLFNGTVPPTVMAE